MNFIAGLSLVLFIFPALCLAGYSLAGLLVSLTAGVRLCLAALAGLGIWLWLVAGVNAFLPLHFGVAWSIIGASWSGTLLLPYARRVLASDLRTLWASPGCRWAVLAPLPLLAGMLVPMAMFPGLVFYDGTSNHDSFFWITGAEWLQQHPYLVSPQPAIDPAVFSVTGAITGVSPPWGRMGTEGLLALLASAFNTLPLKGYVFVQAGLLPLWLASMVVFVRSVLLTRLAAWVLMVGASLQPIFVFFVTNNSMPNLLGALVAPLILVAFVRLTATVGLTRWERLGWGVVAALMLHGLLCTYPEMAPFALFAAGSAVVAKLFQIDRQGRRIELVTGVLLAGIAGLLVQPLSAWRAYQGFWNSFHVARTTMIWGNLFDTLDFSAYVPALITLNVPACKLLGPYFGWFLSVLLVVTLLQIVRRADDKAVAIASLSSFILLIGYTLATDFSYGWQKAVQFSGVIIAGFFSFGSFFTLTSVGGGRSSIPRLAVAATITGLMAYATIWGCTRSYYWAGLKGVDNAFLSLVDLSRNNLKNEPIEVVSATFHRPFFYSMWAVYALPESVVTFDPRGDEKGGYLQGHLPGIGASSPDASKPRAYLVSRSWADTFDAGSIRLSSGSRHVLLSLTNKVVAQAGVFPLSGVPESAKSQFSLTLLPYANGVFEMDLMAQAADPGARATLAIRYGNPDDNGSWQTLHSEYPWRVRLPVHGGSKCRIEVASTVSSQTEYPLQLSGIRLTHQ